MITCFYDSTKPLCPSNPDGIFFFFISNFSNVSSREVPITPRWLGDHSIVNQEADFHLQPAQRKEGKGKAGVDP